MKQKKKLKFGQLIENPRFAKIFSVLLAIVIWFVVVVQFDPMTSKVVRNIPITYNLTNTPAASLGLEVVKVEPETVSVTAEGKRYRISGLSAEDFTVDFSAATVEAAGTYTLNLRVSLASQMDDGETTFIVHPNTVTVTFDKVASKTLDLDAQAPNVTAQEGYILESPVASPDQVVVRGPQQYIERLESGVVVTDLAETLDHSQTVNGELKLYDSDGAEMDSSVFTFNEEQFEVMIPVYKQKEVPLTFRYRNVPSSVDTEELSYQMSVESIQIAGSTEAIDNINEINVGYIDFRELDIGKEFQFSIPIPSGFRNLSSVSDVTVTFDDSGWDSKLLTVSDIQMTNVPSGYEVTANTTAIQNVKIVGPRDTVAALSGLDLVANVDFTNQTINEGGQTVPAVIQVVGYDQVWAVGSYECIVTARRNSG